MNKWLLLNRNCRCHCLLDTKWYNLRLWLYVGKRTITNLSFLWLLRLVIFAISILLGSFFDSLFNWSRRQLNRFFLLTARVFRFLVLLYRNSNLRLKRYRLLSNWFNIPMAIKIPSELYCVIIFLISLRQVRLNWFGLCVPIAFFLIWAATKLWIFLIFKIVKIVRVYFSFWLFDCVKA